MESETEELNFRFYLTLITLESNSHVRLVAPALDPTALDSKLCMCGDRIFSLALDSPSLRKVPGSYPGLNNYLLTTL